MYICECQRWQRPRRIRRREKLAWAQNWKFQSCKIQSMHNSKSNSWQKRIYSCHSYFENCPFFGFFDHCIYFLKTPDPFHSTAFFACVGWSIRRKLNLCINTASNSFSLLLILLVGDKADSDHTMTMNNILTFCHNFRPEHCTRINHYSNEESCSSLCLCND